MRLFVAIVAGVLIGGGGVFLGLRAAEAETQPTPVDGQPFQIERSAVHAVKSGDRTYRVFVKLPPSYDKPESAQRKYPVIYMTDGPYTFQVASGVTRLGYSQKRLQEAILVGIDYDDASTPVESRNRDLTPWPHARRPEQGGGAPAYLAFIKREVLPMVEKRYRADPARRTLAGQSYGGLFGAWVLFQEPTLFDSYVLTSPSLWYAKRKMFQVEAAYAATHKDLPAKVYLITGEFEQPAFGAETDMVGDQRDFATNLRMRGYPGLEVRDEVATGTYHETTFPTGLARGLQWLHPDEGPAD